MGPWSRAWSVVALNGVLTLTSGCRSKHPGEASADWETHRTPDGLLTLRLPPGYEKRNDYGCWDRIDEDRNVWRDFCVELVEPAEAERRTLGSNDCRSADLIMPDCAYYEARRVETVQFGERAAVVERALLSGTIGHYRRRPAVLVRVPLSGAGTAVLHGDHAVNDSGASDELVAIAGTIQLARGG